MGIDAAEFDRRTEAECINAAKGSLGRWREAAQFSLASDSPRRVSPIPAIRSRQSAL